jgi:hypothetical protein
MNSGTRLRRLGLSLEELVDEVTRVVDGPLQLLLRSSGWNCHLSIDAMRITATVTSYGALLTARHVLELLRDVLDVRLAHPPGAEQGRILHNQRRNSPTHRDRQLGGGEDIVLARPMDSAPIECSALADQQL